MKKIGVIGLGHVGSAIAFSLLFRWDSRSMSICITDRRPELLEGEYRDLSHASYLLHEKNIFFKGSWKDFNECDAVIICAGHPRKTPKETDFSLYQRNHALLKGIFSHLSRDMKIIMVTNPAEDFAEAFHCIPAGKILDYVRSKTDKKSGRYILERKGYTNWGIASEVWREL